MASGTTGTQDGLMTSLDRCPWELTPGTSRPLTESSLCLLRSSDLRPTLPITVSMTGRLLTQETVRGTRLPGTTSTMPALSSTPSRSQCPLTQEISTSHLMATSTKCCHPSALPEPTKTSKDQLTGQTSPLFTCMPKRKDHHRDIRNSIMTNSPNLF